VQKKISRAKFLGVGLSAAVLSSGISPFLAKAQTVRFGAATTGKLSQYCRGDGSDETEQINKCFREHLYVEIDEPPAGVGYGFRAYGRGGGGILLRSGHEVEGMGERSKLLRVGKWEKHGKCLRNENRLEGDSSIKLNGIHIEGFRTMSDVPKPDSAADSIAVAIRARKSGNYCNDINLTNIKIYNWPGVSISIRNGSNVVCKEVSSVNPTRGGIVFYTCKHVNLINCRSIESGDDAFAFYCTGIDPHDQRTNRPIFDIVVDRCEASVRSNPEYGATLKFDGAREVQVSNSIFRHSKNSNIYISTALGGFNPRDITVRDCKMLGGMRHSFHINADKANNIILRNSYLREPKGNCVRIQSIKGIQRVFDIRIVDNTMVRPRSGRFFDIQQNLRGIYLARNKLIKADSIKPSIQVKTPKPGSYINDDTPTIQAFVKDNALLSKAHIKLFVARSEIPASKFGYKNGLLSYKASRPLEAGKKTVKIVVRDPAGNSSVKSWSFTIDKTKPKIKDVRPKPQTRVADRRPNIRAIVRDNLGLRKKDLKLYVSSKLVPQNNYNFNPETGLLKYRPPSLPFGRIQVKITAKDRAGNTTEKSWSFTVVKRQHT